MNDSLPLLPTRAAMSTSEANAPMHLKPRPRSTKFPFDSDAVMHIATTGTAIGTDVFTAIHCPKPTRTSDATLCLFPRLPPVTPTTTAAPLVSQFKPVTDDSPRGAKQPLPLCTLLSLYNGEAPERNDAVSSSKMTMKETCQDDDTMSITSVDMSFADMSDSLEADSLPPFVPTLDSCETTKFALKPRSTRRLPFP